jgi:hypothetical protein
MIKFKRDNLTLSVALGVDIVLKQEVVLVVAHL